MAGIFHNLIRYDHDHSYTHTHTHTAVPRGSVSCRASIFKMIILAMMMLMTKTATGQWFNQPSPAVLSDPNARVGIGTFTPAAKLLVQQTGASAVDGIIGQLQTGTFGNILSTGNTGFSQWTAIGRAGISNPTPPLDFDNLPYGMRLQWSSEFALFQIRRPVMPPEEGFPSMLGNREATIIWGSQPGRFGTPLRFIFSQSNGSGERLVAQMLPNGRVDFLGTGDTTIAFTFSGRGTVGRLAVGNAPAPLEALDVRGNAIFRNGIGNQVNGTRVIIGRLTPFTNPVTGLPVALTVNGDIRTPNSFFARGGNFDSLISKNIIAEDFKVEAITEWPDYVFDESHSLMPLEELEHRLKTEKHLPEIPSATEVKQNGVSLNEMQIKLLKKVEELTLYIIDLKKDNQTLKQRVSDLESKHAESK